MFYFLFLYTYVAAGNEAMNTGIPKPGSPVSSSPSDSVASQDFNESPPSLGVPMISLMVITTKWNSDNSAVPSNKIPKKLLKLHP